MTIIENLHKPFWAAMHFHEGHEALAIQCLEEYADAKMESGDAWDAEWQYEIGALVDLLPELDLDWNPTLPGIQLHVRGEEDRIPPVFVLRTDLDSPLATVLHASGEIGIVDLRDGWQEAGQ